MDQPTRTLRHEEQEDKQYRRRHDFSRKHPTPATRNIPILVAKALDTRIDKQSNENAGHNSQLKQRTQAATPVLRGHFCDINGANHGGGPDG